MNESILNFIKENQVATLCLVDAEGQPYCVNCFYVFDESTNSLIFKSSFNTKHESLLKASAPVAGTILPESISLNTIKGIQFNGQVSSDFVLGATHFHAAYAKAFPMSLLLPGYFWIVDLTYIKFTDNSLGFGNKSIWKKEGTA